jgi:hypothetical protein
MELTCPDCGVSLDGAGPLIKECNCDYSVGKVKYYFDQSPSLIINFIRGAASYQFVYQSYERKWKFYSTEEDNRSFEEDTSFKASNPESIADIKKDILDYLNLKIFE